MATVNRPPFWVPRPPDDNIWALQLQRSQALTLSTTELKWYAAPGQVPTKRWLPHLLYDDPGVAYYPRIEWMNSAVLQILTKQKFFGAGGQVPTKNWSQQLTYDDPPPWQFPVNWMDSAAIELLTHQRFFGAGGQVPAKLWSPYLWDDPSPVWQIETNWMNSAAIQQLTSQKIFGQGGQVPPARWNFNYDETGPWQWTLQERNPNLLTLSVQNPFAPVLWRFNYDETPAWNAKSVATNIEFIPVNVPRAAFYALRSGDEHFWQPAVQRNVNLFPAGAAQNPFLPVPWRFNYDETPAWNAQPVATNIEFIPTNMPRAAFYALKPGDEHFWQPAVQRNINLFPASAVQNNLFSPVLWRFNYDDASGWVGKSVPTNINFIPFLIPSFALWIETPDDSPIWQGMPRAVSPAQFPSLPPVNVLNIYRWRFNYDQDPMWQGHPLPGLIVNVPIPPVVGPGVYNTLLLCIPNGMFMIPGNPPS